MHDDRYILHKPDPKALAERIAAMRRSRPHTKPLDAAQHMPIWQQWLVIGASFIVLAGFLVLAIWFVLRGVG